MENALPIALFISWSNRILCPFPQLLMSCIIVILWSGYTAITIDRCLCLVLYCLVNSTQQHCLVSGHVYARPPLSKARRSMHRKVPPILSTCPLRANSGCGEERRIIIGSWSCKDSTRYRNYLDDYWLCAGGLSAVNAIGTRWRDPINSELTRWRMAVWITKWMPPRKPGGIP